ncbi:MAG: hypothetical protein AB1505_19625, partial [Candidatus Latescibacterota bacterium]
RREVNVTWRDPRWSSQDGGPDPAQERSEKALHRLVMLGVVEDHTVSRASQEYGVRMAGATAEDIAAAFGRYAGAYQRRLGEQVSLPAVSARVIPGLPDRETGGREFPSPRVYTGTEHWWRGVAGRCRGLCARAPFAVKGPRDG